jgi:hypothetical protein
MVVLATFRLICIAKIISREMIKELGPTMDRHPLLDLYLEK